MKIELPGHIDLNLSQKCTLCIQVNNKEFSFALSSPETNEIYLHTISGNKQLSAFANFQAFFFENEFFTLPYKDLYIINNTSVFTFVPSTIFEEKDKEKYLNFNFLENRGKILTQMLENPEMTILHVIPEDIYDFFLRSVTKPHFIHHLSSLITYFQEKSLIGGINKMIINFHQNTLDILCYSHSSFVFANQFQCQTKEDVVYYILFIWKQLKFNQLNDFVYLFKSGQEQVFADILKEYIKNIVVLDQPGNVPADFLIFDLI